MRKFIATIVIIGVIGALLIGVSVPDIMKYFIEFFKDCAVWITSWLKEFAEYIRETAFSYVPGS